MNLILFDDEQRERFYPLSLTRPIANFRLGIGTLAEKWEKISGLKASFLVPDYLESLFPIKQTEDNIFINSRCVPNREIWEELKTIPIDSFLYHLPKESLKDPIGNSSFPKELDLNFNPESFSLPTILAGRFKSRENFLKLQKILPSNPKSLILGQLLNVSSNYDWLNYTEDLIKFNAKEIIKDFEGLSLVFPLKENVVGEQFTDSFRDTSIETNKISFSVTNRIIGNRIWIHPTAKVEYATLNTQTGPIYIDEDVEIMEGSLIRGPVAIMKGSIVKMGAKIYGGTSIGPRCTVGGEVKNSILIANSNKAHEGYLGDSILGEWCNLGADTNNSNMKNNYKHVKVFDYVLNKPRETDLMFLGLILGDHVKSGINSTFNTGTVLGVGVNWFGSALSPNFIPDFSWAESGNIKEYTFDKMVETTRRAKARRNESLDEKELKILEYIFKLTQTLRNYKEKN